MHRRPRLFCVVPLILMVMSCDSKYFPGYCDTVANKLDKEAQLYIEKWASDNSLDKGFVRLNDPNVVKGHPAMYRGLMFSKRDLFYKSEFNWEVFGFDKDKSLIKLDYDGYEIDESKEFMEIDAIHFFEFHRNRVIFDVGEIGDAWVGAPYDYTVKVSDRITVVCMDR